MQRNFLRGLLICLIPCLLAALFAARVDKYRLGIDLAGGTILVYEINLERTKARKATAGDTQQQPGDQAEGLNSDEMNQLAAQIKRRIDPTDIKNVTVRPLGRTRVEIILPTGGAAGGKANLSAEDIEEIKKLISQMGVLEFRILANGQDDSSGLEAARDTLEEAGRLKSGITIPGPDGQPVEANELERLALNGLPPPPPPGTYSVNINDTTEPNVKYAWIELGREERESLGLSNTFEGQRGGRWEQMAMARANPVPQVVPIGGDLKTCQYVLYSRVCISKDQLDDEAKRREKIKAENPSISPEDLEAQVNPKKYEYFMLTRVSDSDTLKVGGDITLSATLGTDRASRLAVDFRFNGAGARKFGDITRRNKPSSTHTRHLAILLDERIVSAPALQAVIEANGQITGGGPNGFERKSAERLVQILRSGALSAELREKPVSENTIGPTLGADTIRRGTSSIGFAFLAVLAFMVVYYRFAGLVACVALFANLLLTVGFMVAVNAAFTLPGLAGLVLTLGMAVDANVLIYERLREERNRGANLATALRNGYDRAFLTIIDTHLTSIFTAVVLYTFGNDQLKGFAITLSVGLIISLFTSLYMTRLLFDYWLHRRWLTELKMMRLFERPNLNPMKYRWFFFPLTGTLTLIGLVVFLGRGEEGLNVDFRGGTVFAGKLRDGEERGMIATADGKPGFRELLGEGAQKARLTPVSARWDNEPRDASGVPTGGSVNVYVYTITYADGAQATVALTEKPGGPDATPAEMAADVVRRAGQLPDVSVEQMFLSGEKDYGMGKSKYFTIRTTEKQRALVQASLDRLMRTDQGGSLLDGGTMSYPVAGTVPVELFEKDNQGQERKTTTDVPAPVLSPDGKVVLMFSKHTSRSYVEELLKREFLKALGSSEAGADVFSLTTPEGLIPGTEEQNRNSDGKHKMMILDVSGNPLLGRVRSPEDTPERRAQFAPFALALHRAKTAFDNTPEPERLEVFDSQLAQETRTKALFAILLSWGAILLYLWLRFGNWTFGLAAVICLVHDLSFTLGIIAMCHYLHLIPGMSNLGIQDFKIDMAAVAALLTLVGYSVNEIIVNFARVREVRGKNPQLTPQMVNDSVNQTLSRTILTAGTTFLVSAVLYVFGGEGVHLFAFVMMVGVAVATYSSIFVACPLLLFLGEGRETAGTAAQQQDEQARAEAAESQDGDAGEG